MNPCAIPSGIPTWFMSTASIKFLLKAGVLGLLTLGMPALCGAVLPHREAIFRQIPGWVQLYSLDGTITLHTVQGEETVHAVLDAGVLVLETEKEVFRTEEDWITADCFVFDVDHDGCDEVMLHVWKPGSFGEFQPFWMEPDNRREYSEHLFIYEWDMNRADRLDPVWMSSAMPVQGQNVLIEEGGVIRILAPDGSETGWCWEDWGLRLVHDARFPKTG